MLAPALHALIALSPLAAAPPAAASHTEPVAVQFVVDASEGMTRPQPRMPMVLSALQDVFKLTSRKDLKVAVRVYGASKAAGDCSDTTLLQSFSGPGDTAFVDKVDPLRDFGAAPLARAIAEAGADLLATRARDRLLVIVAAGPDGCGGNGCAAVEQLLARGLRHPRVIHVSDQAEIPDGLACMGSLTHASTASELTRAFVEALADAGPDTGIEVSHWSGSGSAEPVSFALRPLPGRAREGLKTATARASEIYSVPPGSYELAMDAPGAAPLLVTVSDGHITRVASGDGSLVVHALNYWGDEIPARVEIVPSGVGQARARSAAVDRSQPGTRGRNSTLPVAPSAAGEPAAALASAPATAPARAPAAATTTPVAVGGPAGSPIDLPAGRYDVRALWGGGAVTARDVRIAAGKASELTFRFGGLRVTEASGRLAIHASDGRRVAETTGPGATIQLAPGRYSLRSVDGQRIVAEDVEVRAGDVTLVEGR